MKTYLLVLLILITGCKSSQKSAERKENTKVDIGISISEISINFNIKNVTSEPLNILNPRKLTIQKFEGEAWQNLKILICPCDAPCNAPKEKEQLLPNVSYPIAWNKKESWCGSRTEHGIRETVESVATKGKYRITFSFEKNGESFDVVKEFEINI
jgi:hypothetical protein